MTEQLFVQSVVWKGEEIEPSWLFSATLTLKINSLAPRLSLTLLNPHNTLLEDLDIQPGGRLKIRFMDYFSDDSGDLSEFVIAKRYPAQNPNYLTLECLEKTAWRLSRRDYRVFNKMSVSAILGVLAPDIMVDCGCFSVDNTGNLAGERRFNLAARLARELGGVFALSFGKLLFKTKEELYAEKDQAVYEHNNPGVLHGIFDPRFMDQHYMMDEKKRRYLGWSQEEGLVVSNVNEDRPTRMVSADIPRKLDNIAAVTAPSLRFNALGNAELRPGLPVKLIWHTDIPERPIDEAYPERALIGQLVHHEKRGKKFNFSTRIYCVV